MPGHWATSTRRTQLPTDWPQRRARILKRDGYRCTWPTPAGRCTHPANQVDHIHPGDDHRDTNLQSLCAAHHAAKSSAEGNQAQATRRARLRRPPDPHPGLTGTRGATPPG